MRRLLTAATVAVTVAAGGAAILLTDGPGGRAAAAPVGATGPDTVTVTTGDVTDVTTLPSRLVARPSLLARAGASGRLHWLPGRGGTGDTVATVGAWSLRLPADVTPGRRLVAEGAAVVSGEPLLSSTYSGYGETAQVPPEAAYHVLDHVLSARAEITGGPGPFDCPLAQAPTAPDSATGGPTVVCLVPLTTRAYDGLTGTIALRSSQATGVAVLPVAAVAGAADQGQVLLVTGGHSVLRHVVLGAGDGAQVEIVSGLSVGDTVSAQAPDLSRQEP